MSEANKEPILGVLQILPTKVWIEDDMMGSRHVLLQTEGFEEPFIYATFNYNYAYTSNAQTLQEATKLAIRLGATEPVERRYQEWKAPTAEELRERIGLLQDCLEETEKVEAASVQPPRAGQGEP